MKPHLMLRSLFLALAPPLTALLVTWAWISPLFTPWPTRADVAYGKHPKQVLHFWKAESSQPTPLVVYLHGGGWIMGNRTSGVPPILAVLLKNGISLVSIEYRFIPEAAAGGESPPLRGPLRDAARALQFVRSRAAEWRIDKQRIALCGNSAGACAGLWLAFHADLADPASADPIARESTRPWCVAVTSPQTSLDPKQMREWSPSINYGGYAFGFKPDPARGISEFDAFLAARDKILPWIAEYSPYQLAAAGAPPIYMAFNMPPALGQREQDPDHSSNFGLKLQEKLATLGVPCELAYPGAPGVTHPTVQDYLIDKLKR